MKRPTLTFLEPSKVRAYHATFNDGWLSALLFSREIQSHFDVKVAMHPSAFACLSEQVRRAVFAEPVPVVDQDLHAVLQKSLWEAFVCLKYMLRMRRGDALLVSCVMPSALILIELGNLILRRESVYVVLHGEIESLTNTQRGSFASVGTWCRMWLRLRPLQSRIQPIVIDSFIRRALSKLRNPKLSSISAIPQVVHSIARPSEDGWGPSVCFVGFNTKAKGFPVFQRLAREVPGWSFLAVGRGVVETVPGGEVVAKAATTAEYLHAISTCYAAVFPYTGGYEATVSGAAFDAVSAGTHIIATGLPFFKNLAAVLGPDFVTICDSYEEIANVLQNPGRLVHLKQQQAGRLIRVNTSPYGFETVRQSLERLLLPGTEAVQMDYRHSQMSE